jgi:NADH:ubiquinone oxidoreductase subunit 4 (subunit M)
MFNKSLLINRSVTFKTILLSSLFLLVSSSASASVVINPSTVGDSFIGYLISPAYTIVSFLILFTFGVLITMCIPGKRLSLIRFVSLLVTFIPVLWSLYLMYLYDSSGQTLQCVGYIPGLHLSFGIDAVGLSLVVLTTTLFPLCVYLMRTYKGIITFLLLELVILGALLVLDVLGFYILFEASLILLFLLIARPNLLIGFKSNNQYHQRSSYGTMDAAYKIVLYTMAGSLAFLPVIFILYSIYGSTNLLVLTTANDVVLSKSQQLVLGWGLLAVFAVKIPLMPLHLWLPEAHVASPTSGSILLAGVLLKLGGIGIIRYLIPLFPSFTVSVFPIIAVMCLGSFLFTTLSTLKQVDLKKIVAYSSIGHMALVTLAIFSMSEHSIYSSTYMMIAHGIVSPGYSGLCSIMPIFAIVLFLLTAANLSFPLFPNFIAEILCLVSLFAVSSLYSYIFCAGQVLGACVFFWAYNRVVFGYPSVVFTNKGCLTDLSRKELLFVTPIMLGVFWLGLKQMA